MKEYLLIASAFLVPAAVSAQGPSASPTAPKPVLRTDVVRELDSSFARIDANRDGIVTKVEADASQERARQQNIVRLRRQAEQQFAQLDTDKNGQISLAEFTARAGAARVPSGESVIALLDSNKDKQLTIQEFRAKRLAQFDTLDVNRDGTLTQLEMRRKR